MSDAIKPSTETVHRWLAQLCDCDESVRIYAAMRLTAPGLDTREAIPHLHDALSDENPDLRRLASWILERLSDQRTAAA